MPRATPKEDSGISSADLRAAVEEARRIAEIYGEPLRLDDIADALAESRESYDAERDRASGYGQLRRWIDDAAWSDVEVERLEAAMLEFDERATGPGASADDRPGGRSLKGYFKAAIGIGDDRPWAEQAVDLVDYIERKRGEGIDPSEVIRLYGISRLSYDRARQQKHRSG